jgi:NarL family two-component system response regulator LiaR
MDINMTEKIRLLICDDHPIVREGLRNLMLTTSDIDVVGEAENGLEAIRLAEKLKPDVILMDLVMPQMDGIEAIKNINAKHITANILVLTSFSEDDKVFPAIKAGALGYLLKDTAPQEVLNAIREIARGESFLHPTIARKLIKEINQPPQLPAADHPLTEREMEVVTLIAQGLSTQEISKKLTITERTVCTHVSNILNKLHLANRTQVALYALRGGLTKLENE